MLGGSRPENSKRSSFQAGFEDEIEDLSGGSEINPTMATGWMVDRMMEVLEQHPERGLDPRKMVVSGCSGRGQGALLVGVFSRIPPTIIVEPGAGGSAVNLRQARCFGSSAWRAVWQGGDGTP